MIKRLKFTRGGGIMVMEYIFHILLVKYLTNNNSVQRVSDGVAQ